MSHAAWTCGGLDGNTIGVDAFYVNPMNADWPGIMAHELGHVLGLHQEQFHTQGGGCSSGGTTRDVTPTADLGSIMGYRGQSSG